VEIERILDPIIDRRKTRIGATGCWPAYASGQRRRGEKGREKTNGEQEEKEGEAKIDR